MNEVKNRIQPGDERSEEPNPPVMNEVKNRTNPVMNEVKNRTNPVMNEVKNRR